MQFRRVKKPATAMDMGPLLDCVLLLLIFFMLSATFMSPAIRITLPEAATTEAPTDPDAIIITAAADGRLFVNHDPVVVEGLYDHLRPLIERSHEKTVSFRGDQAIPYRTFIRAIDAARRAGARHLDIAHTLDRERGADGS